MKIINKKVMAATKHFNEVKVLKAIKMLGKEIIKLVSYLNDQNAINLRHALLIPLTYARSVLRLFRSVSHHHLGMGTNSKKPFYVQLMNKMVDVIMTCSCLQH